MLLQKNKKNKNFFSLQIILYMKEEFNMERAQNDNVENIEIEEQIKNFII